MNIAVNFSYKLIASRGIARFIENILVNLPKSDNEYFFFVPKGTVFNSKFKNKINYVELNSSNYFIFEHISVPAAVKKYNINVLINPANTVPLKKNCKWISVIHDVIPFKLKSVPFTKKWLVNIYMRTVMARSIKKSEQLATVSEYSKNDIDSLGIKHNDITVIYNGFNHKGNISTDSKDAKKLKLPKSYYFWLGGDGYNKNMQLVVELLKRKKVNKKLCVVGVKRQENIELLQSLGAKVYVNVSDEELAALYSNTKVFIFPSLYEGFGIPVLEAMNYNVPYIICSNRTSIPEVCGESCYLADPSDIENFEKLINDAFDDKLKSLVRKYSKQLSKFKWNQEALKLDSLIKGFNK